MKNNLLSFLFLESAKPGATDVDDCALERLLEAIGDVETSDLESKKTPLAKALGEFGITDSDLQLDPEGFCLATDNHDRYIDIINVLGTPDAMHKLAEMGWVVSKLGDAAMTSEPAEYRVRFLEITTVDSGEDKEKGEAAKAIAKKAREFATTPLDRDDDLNPVEDKDGKMGKNQVGVGKPKDGEKAEKAIHDSINDDWTSLSQVVIWASNLQHKLQKVSPDHARLIAGHLGGLESGDINMDELNVVIAALSRMVEAFPELTDDLNFAKKLKYEAKRLPESLQEMTSTGSMGTVEGGPQGIVAPGIIKKPKPYGKGTKFAMPGQWKVKQPIVNAQVKRKPQSEALGLPRRYPSDREDIPPGANDTGQICPECGIAVSPVSYGSRGGVAIGDEYQCPCGARWEDQKGSSRVSADTGLAPGTSAEEFLDDPPPRNMLQPRHRPYDAGDDEEGNPNV